MQRDIPIGLGAGLAAAILILAPLSGSGLGLLLAFFAALPITLVTLGWGYRAGLVAAVASMVILAVVASTLSSSSAALDGSPLRLGLEFGVSRALPAWGLAYLVIAGFGQNTDGRGQIPLGTLAVVAAILSAVSALFAMLSLGSSYDDAIANLEQELTAAYRIMMSIPKDQPIPRNGGLDAQAFFHTFSRFMLPMTAFATTIFNLCGLWLAGRIARISGRLPRQWPDVAALYLPQWSFGLIVLGCGLALLPDVYGFAGQLLVAAMFGAFVVQGFAVVHFLTRGNGMRPLILSAVYLACVFLLTIALPLVALLGMIETLFNLRDRFGGRPNSPNIPKTFD